MADKEDIRDRNDIVEVIGNVVPLKKKGKTYLGLCPFHQEKTPSFNVDPIYRSYKCYGCGASGDVFSFIERYENMTFVEAADFLARRVGVTFERKGGEADSERASERDQLFAVNAVALAWFRKMLDRAQTAKDYIYGRGLAHDTIQRFQLGYAPQGWDNLTSYLSAQRFDLKVASVAGLVQVGKTSDYYDMFRHRVIFPILDEQERVVGFGGRAFGDDQPKYLNTGETPIFNKSRLLYGLSLARRKISAENRVLLMEGYMDVIAAQQAGFTNAVATLGTSLTREHAKKLAQLAPTVCLVYDADNAGIKATLRAAEVFKEVQDEGVREVDLRMVRLPDGEDPDSVLKRGDVALFQRAVDDAGEYVDYLIDAAKRRQNLATEAGKSKFLSDLSRILVDVPQMEVCDAYMTQYANLHPYSRYSLQSAVEQMRRELLERKQKMRQRSRPNRSPQPAPPRSEGPQSEPVLPQAGAVVPKESGRTAPSGPQPQNARREDRPYRPPMSREERLELEKRRYRQSIQPVEGPRTVLTTEERAENELVRALMEPEWRASVLKHIKSDELVTPPAQRLFNLVEQNSQSLGWEADAVIRLVEAQHDEPFSTAVRDRAQEFRAHMANVPIAEELIVTCAETLHRFHKEKRAEWLAEELARLLQKSPLSEEERASIREYTAEHQRVLKELKGSA
jgi:DNA primase